MTPLMSDNMKSMQTIKRFLLVGYIGLLFTPFFVARAAAPAATNTAYQLTTSPVSVNLQGKPGSAITTDLRVRNDSQVSERIHLNLLKFSAQGEEGKPVLDNRGDQDAYFDWVSFSQNDFWLVSNEWATVKMTINIPLSAANGYYYAVRFSRAGDVANTPAVPGQHTYLGSNSILVLLDAHSDTAKRNLSVLSFSASQQVYEALPASFSARLNNTGNVHIVPAGSIFITQGKKQLAVLDFNASGGNILPGSKRIYTTSWSDGFPHFEQKKDETGTGVVDKKGKPVMKLVWNFNQLSNIRFGQYTAKLISVYQDNDGRDIPLEAVVSFWVIPWKVIAVLILVIVFVPIGMYATGRTVWKKTKHKEK